MKTAKQLHHDAIESLQKADEALVQQNVASYYAQMKAALQAETDAAMLLIEKTDAEPTRSVLFRSAASIAIDCGEFTLAEDLIVAALKGNPPAEIKDELLELFHGALAKPMLSANDAILKRVFDLVFSALVLTWLFPLLISVAIIIEADSKGPGMIKELRKGRNNKLFYCFKFRTTEYNAEANRLTETEPKFTRIGAFLHRHAIDELPMFINVLRGEMTVVGPRPIPARSLRSRVIDVFMTRLNNAPGIFNTSDSALDAAHENAQNAYYTYAKQWSLTTDIKIAFYSLLRLFRNHRNIQYASESDSDY